MYSSLIILQVSQILLKMTSCY